MAILAFFKDGERQNISANIGKKKVIIYLSIIERGYSVSHQCHLCPSMNKTKNLSSIRLSQIFWDRLPFKITRPIAYKITDYFAPPPVTPTSLLLTVVIY